jgi:hypothetical protein
MAGGTLEVFQNDYPYGVVTTGGTDTADATWVVSAQSPFPQANYTGNPPLVFHVADPAYPQETIQVNYNNQSNGTWFVTRGAENSSAVAHPAGFTVRQVVSGTNGFGSFYQLANLAASAYTTVQNTVTATNIASIYVPSSGTQPGGAAAGVQYELNAFGTLITSTAANATGSVLLYWDTATGTAIASLVPSLNATELLATLATPVSIESTVSFLNATQAVGMIQMVWKNAAAATGANATDLGVSTAPVTINGTSGAAQQLCLTWHWATATNNTISVIGAAYQVQ